MSVKKGQLLESLMGALWCSGAMYQVGDFDETLETRVALDVEPVELNAVAPGLPWLQQVLDLVTVHIDGEHGMLRLPHQLVAQVGPDESSGSDHTDLERLNRLPIQVQPRGRHRNRTKQTSQQQQLDTELGEFGAEALEKDWGGWETDGTATGRGGPYSGGGVLSPARRKRPASWG